VKKLLLSILTIIYMTVSSGVAMEIHYCMGKRAGVDFYQSEKDKCSRCGMKEKKAGCCNDEHKFYKLADAHKNVFNDLNANVSHGLIVNDYNSFSGKFFLPSRIIIIPKEVPPRTQNMPVFIRNCVFRI
jgi:hypothetical protein